MRTVYAILLLLSAPALAFADLKVTTKNTAGGRSIQSTIYIKGQRQRTDGAGVATVYQCDLKRILHLNDRARKYSVTRLDDEGGAPTPGKTSAAPARARRGGIVTYTVTTTDTGERRQMFGYTARHLKSTMVIDAPQGTCDPGRTEMETDGWYIDLQFAFNCTADRPAAPTPPPARGDCLDETRYVQKGAARLGFPVLLTTRMKLAGGDQPEDAEAAAMMSQMMTTTMEVTDISSATLDPSLFDVPAGYAEASSMGELYGSAGAVSPPRGDVGGRTEPAALPRDEVTPPATPVAAKAAGVIRIGVAAIDDRTGRGVSTESLRQTLVASITGTGVEAVPLGGGDPVSESRRLDCDFILYTDLAALKQSAGKLGGGILGRVTGVQTPGGKYEARVEFRLVAAGGDMQLQSSATAKEDGEEASAAAALRKEAGAVTTAARKRN